MGDGIIAEKLDRSLNRECLLLFQIAQQPAAHPVVAAGKDDESCLMSGILAAVTEDQQSFFAIVARTVVVGFSERFDLPFSDDFHGR